MGFNEERKPLFRFFRGNIFAPMIFQQVSHATRIHRKGLATVLHGMRSALISDFIHRLDTTGKPTGKQRNRACRRNRKQRPITQPRKFNQMANFGERLDYRRFQRLFKVKLPERPLLGSQRCRGHKCLLHDNFHNVRCHPSRFLRTIANPHGHKSIGKTEHTKTNTAPIRNGFPVQIQRLHIIAIIENFIQHPHSNVGNLTQMVLVNRRMVSELILDDVVNIDGTQIAGVAAITEELRARIRYVDFILRITREQIETAYPVNKDCAGVSPIPLRFTELTEERTRINGFLYMPRFRAVIGEFERLIFLHGFHKLIRELDGDIHRGQLGAILLNPQKFLNIGMVTPQTDHQCCPAPILTNRAAGHIKDIKKRHRPGRSHRTVIYWSILGAQIINSQPTATAIGRNTGNHLRRIKDGFNIILRRRQHIAITHAHLTLTLITSTEQRAPGREKISVLQNLLSLWFQFIAEYRSHTVYELLRLLTFMQILSFHDAHGNLVIVPH